MAITSESVRTGAFDKIMKIVGGITATNARSQPLARVSDDPNNTNIPTMAQVHSAMIALRFNRFDMVVTLRRWQRHINLFSWCCHLERNEITINSLVGLFCYQIDQLH